MPHWSDEISYWNQINTFRAVGLNGGYFAANEVAAPAAFTHFFAYGPWYPAIYGSIAHFFGGNPPTVLAINALLLGLALVVFCLVTHLDRRQLLVAILLLATTWGLLLYFFTGMQEGFQQTLTVLLASLFVIALRERDNLSLRSKVIGCLLIAFAALMRLSWAILFLPFLVLTGTKTIRYWIIYIVITLIATGAIMAFGSYTSSHGNTDPISDMINAFHTSIGGGAHYLINYLFYNLGSWIFMSKPRTDVLQTYQIIVVIVGLSAMSIQLYLHRRKKSPLRAEVLFHLYNLSVTIIAACALYIIGTGGDYRLLACHFMLSLLVFLAFKRYRPLMLIIATNLLCVLVFFGDFRTISLSKYDPDHSAYSVFKQAADTYIKYDPHVNNSWCNTLLFSVKNYDGTQFVGTPAGIGLSFFRDPANPLLTFKSRYLLLDDTDYQVINARDNAPHLMPLEQLPIGKLYLNQSANCPSDGT